MVLLTEETRLRRAALIYVMNLHNGLTQENGAPPLGTQNQTVNFILGDRNCAGR
jgi:ABC-type histidine transport system ATPase subunit